MYPSKNPTNYIQKRDLDTKRLYLNLPSILCEEANKKSSS